jgi:hypothetical protein
MAYQVGFVIVHQKEKKKSINPKEGTKTHVVVNLCTILFLQTPSFVQLLYAYISPQCLTFQA